MAADSAQNITNSANDAFPITPNDNSDLPVRTRWLLVSSAGNIKITLSSGTAVTIPIPVGCFPIRIDRVHATGTTATGLAGLA